MKNMKNMGRIVLPIIILLLIVRINAVPVKAFDMIVRNLPNSGTVADQRIAFVFSRIRKDIWYGTEGGGLSVMMDIQ